MFLLAKVLLLVVVQQTHCGRLENLERKIQGLEMLILQDIHMLREDQFGTSKHLELILEMINGTKILQKEAVHEIDGMESDLEGAKTESSDLEEIIDEQLNRVKRAFAKEKMQIIVKQDENESKLDLYAQKLESALSKVNDKVDSKLHSVTQTVYEQLDLYAQKLESALSKVNDKVDSKLLTATESVYQTLDSVERNVNSSLHQNDQNQELLSERINTNIETSMENLRRVIQNSNNNEVLYKTVQAIESLEKSYLTTVFLQTVKLNHGLMAFIDSRLKVLSKAGMVCGGENPSDEVCNLFHSFSNVPTPLQTFDNTIRLRNWSVNVPYGGLQGRLEVFYNNEWGTVCDDDFNNTDATVACRMLGYRYGEHKPEAYFGPGSEPTWLDNVQCTGNEVNLFDCSANAVGVENCDHIEDVGVICTD